ncbi:MAG: Gfo/Idh/MocA family oxidoreductase [Cyclobacteriaceae bacterium]|nr:Gfo/Idh/MocA family oxidoreductase [Cyclobacteriaceae bacterium]
MKKKKITTSSGLSRRKFVKMASSGAAVFSIVPSFTVSGLGHVPPSDKLYIAAIGCGGEGENDIHHYANAPKKNAVISHLCDVDDRMAAPRIREFPKARFYYDWRELFEKESKNFDAVSVAIPDHNHAIVGLSAMQLNKHLYLQKPLSHDIHEARILTQAAEKYKVVTQMGDQGASSDGMFTLREWIEAGLLGEIEKVYCWTDRPVWPQGIAWPAKQPNIPKELKWDLWLGTAESTDYIDNLVPFNWRGWWRFGTGALGDMGCHIMGPPFKLLDLGYPYEVSGSASTVYDGIFSEANFPQSGPVSSSIKFKFRQKNGKNLDLYWMDGGIAPERPDELSQDVNMNDVLGDYPGLNDFEGSTLFIGTRGKAACGWGGRNPRLLPLRLNDEVSIPKKYERVPGDMDGHWWQWVDACIAGYGNMEVSSPFVGYAGPLTETVLMGNLLLRSFTIRKETRRIDPVYGEMSSFTYPGRYISHAWDAENMKVTNFEPANQFVKREYRPGWGELKL